jgi:N-acetylglucosamine-6-phosphate deacetylase
VWLKVYTYEFKLKGREIRESFENLLFYDMLYELRSSSLQHESSEGEADPEMGINPDTFRAFIRGRIFTPEIEIPDGTLVTRGSSILGLGKTGEITFPAGTELVDCTGKIIVPGFIDLHVHGGGGFDFSDERGLLGAARFHASRGTTCLVPTLCPGSIPRMKGQLNLLGNGYPSEQKSGLPEILGLHMEGPFLNPGNRGTFDPDRLIPPRSGLVKELHDASEGKLCMMSLAPELAGSMDVVREIRDLGMIPALGHSDATYDEAQNAFSAGVCHVTHLWNAMRGFHHREPGCSMAALFDPDVSVELIVDGHHLHDATIKMIHRLKGPERMILVSDASPLAGKMKGSFIFGGQQVMVQNGRAVNNEGNLAGSLVTMGDALRKAVKWAHIHFRFAIRMATLNPARLLGVSNRKGRLFEGGDADMVVLNNSLEVESVYIGGIEVHQDEERAGRE